MLVDSNIEQEDFTSPGYFYPDVIKLIQGTLASSENETLSIQFNHDKYSGFSFLDRLDPGYWIINVEALDDKAEKIYCNKSYVQIKPGVHSNCYISLSPVIEGKVKYLGVDRLDNQQNKNREEMYYSGSNPGSLGIRVNWGEFSESALVFDGIDDMVIIQQPDSNINNIHHEITIDCWIYINSLYNVYPRVIDRSDNIYPAPRGKRYLIAISPEQVAQFNLNGYVVNSFLVMLNQWIHIAGTYNGKSMSIYVDGSLQNSVDVDTEINVVNSPLYFGNNELNNRQFDGRIARIRIWDKALSSQQIKTIMYQGSEEKLIEFEPVAGWNIDEGEGQFLYDFVGRNDAKLGSTWESDMNDPIWISLNSK